MDWSDLILSHDSACRSRISCVGCPSQFVFLIACHLCVTYWLFLHTSHFATLGVRVVRPRLVSYCTKVKPSPAHLGGSGVFGFSTRAVLTHPPHPLVCTLQMLSVVFGATVDAHYWPTPHLHQTGYWTPIRMGRFYGDMSFAFPVSYTRHGLCPVTYMVLVLH